MFSRGHFGIVNLLRKDKTLLCIFYDITTPVLENAADCNCIHCDGYATRATTWSLS